jgi:hypothetical protein
MKRLMILPVLLFLLISHQAAAQQSEDFGDFEVHYNAINTDLLSPQVAQAYGIRRSSSRAMINVTVMKKEVDRSPVAVKAQVTASGRNLTGQTREIKIREISESDDAVYYIGEISVRNMETFDFSVRAIPAGSNSPLDIKFRKQFYTE